MRVRNMLCLFSSFVIASGCSDSTTPSTSAINPVSEGWQVVIQSTLAWVDPVYAIKTDVFNRLSIEDFRFANSAVVNLKSVNDTVWAGYGISSRAYRQDFARDSIDWSFSGSMSPSSPGIKFGNFASFFQYTRYDTAYRVIGSPTNVQLPLAIIGDNFQFARRVNLRGARAVEVIAIVVRPFVCSQFLSRQLLSNGVTETMSDSLNLYKNRMSTPGMTITCNPVAPTALRATRADTVDQIMVVNFYKSKHPSIR